MSTIPIPVTTKLQPQESIKEDQPWIRIGTVLIIVLILALAYMVMGSEKLEQQLVGVAVTQLGVKFINYIF